MLVLSKLAMNAIPGIAGNRICKHEVKPWKINVYGAREPTKILTSGVARAFPAHPEYQNEEENKSSLRKNKKNSSKFEEKMRKVEPLPTRNCEAGYGPDSYCN